MATERSRYLGDNRVSMVYRCFRQRKDQNTTNHRVGNFKRKTLLLVSGMLLLGGKLASEDLSLGCRTGVTLSQMYGSFYSEQSDLFYSLGAADVDSRLYPSYVVDLLLQWHLLKYWALSGELVFGPIGGTIVATNGSSKLLGITSTALRIPILFTFLSDLGPGQIKASSGLYVGLSLFNVTQVYREGDIRSEQLLREGLGPLFAGLIAALGYDFSLGPGFVTTEVRFNWGLSSIIEEELIGNHRLMVYSIDIMTGYRFPLVTNKIR